jgi:acyl-CoA thioester hydrolase
VKEVKCSDDTNELSKDEISLGGTMIDASGKTSKISALDVGDFKTGDVRKYSSPKTIGSFDLSKGTSFPRTYYALLALAEIDMGGFAGFLDELVDSVEDEVSAALAKLAVDDAILDGEIVALDPEGRSHFQLLQQREISDARPPICYYVFDLLRLNGRSFVNEPFERRRALLERLLKKATGAVRISTAFAVPPEQLFEEARWELITARGYGLDTIRATRLGPVILEAQVKFRREVKNRDRVVIRTSLLSYDGKIGKLRQRLDKEDGALACDAIFTCALWDIDARKIVLPTPEWAHAIFLDEFLASQAAADREAPAERM